MRCNGPSACGNGLVLSFFNDLELLLYLVFEMIDLLCWRHPQKLAAFVLDPVSPAYLMYVVFKYDVRVPPPSLPR